MEQYVKQFIKKSIKNIKTFSKKIKKDSITGYAAQSCFYITLSFLPFLLVTMSLIHYLPVTNEDIIKLVQSIAPSQLIPIFIDVINDIYNNSSLTITSITALTAIWSAGRGFMAIINGLNTIYQVEADPTWLKLRIKSTIYTVVFIFAIVASLILLVFGNTFTNILAKSFPNIAYIITSILGKKIIFFPCLFTLLFAIIFAYVPNRKSSFIRELPGAAITALGWYLFSNIYSIYVEHSPGFSYMYRGLTALVFALFWIYFSMIIMFFGAEFNWYLKNHSRKDVPG